MYVFRKGKHSLAESRKSQSPFKGPCWVGPSEGPWLVMDPDWRSSRVPVMSSSATIFIPHVVEYLLLLLLTADSLEH